VHVTFVPKNFNVIHFTSLHRSEVSYAEVKRQFGTPMCWKWDNINTNINDKISEDINRIYGKGSRGGFL